MSKSSKRSRKKLKPSETFIISVKIIRNGANFHQLRLRITCIKFQKTFWWKSAQMDKYIYGGRARLNKVFPSRKIKKTVFYTFSLKGINPVFQSNSKALFQINEELDLFKILLLLEVKLPYEPSCTCVGRLIGQLVCRHFKFRFPCSYRSTCLYFFLFIISPYLWFFHCIVFMTRRKFWLIGLAIHCNVKCQVECWRNVSICKI